MNSQIGVVIIGRNEAARLPNCIKSVNAEAQSIVFVDSGSTDNSIALAAQMGVHTVALDMSIPFTAARARNAGFQALLTKPTAPQLTQFIDGDCALAPGWLKTAADFLKAHDEIVAVCGRRKEMRPDLSVYNWLADIEWNTPEGPALSFGGDVLIKTDALLQAGGYRDDLISGEEPELCIRLRTAGGGIWRLPDDMTIHDSNIFRFSQWWKRSVRGGYGMARVAWLHAGSKLGIWKREVARSIFYAGVTPLCILIPALFLSPWFTLLIAVYPLTFLRVAYRRRDLGGKRWAYSAFMLMSKFAEFQGILRFAADQLIGTRSKLIEYKT